MASNILDWQNEHALTDYPLSAFIGYNDVVVDASFIQFDNFVPVLKTIAITDLAVTFTIEFDRETLDVVVEQTSFEPQAGVRIYGANNRYLGCLVLSHGVNNLFVLNAGTVQTLNIPFAATTVTSISTAGGVYSIDEQFGDLEFDTGLTDLVQEIFFAIDGNVVTWNAVGYPELPTDSIQALKTLNGAIPLHNAVNITETALVKITPQFGGLTFSLANGVLNDNIAPLAKYE